MSTSYLFYSPTLESEAQPSQMVPQFSLQPQNFQNSPAVGGASPVLHSLWQPQLGPNLHQNQQPSRTLSSSFRRYSGDRDKPSEDLLLNTPMNRTLNDSSPFVYIQSSPIQQYSTFNSRGYSLTSPPGVQPQPTNRIQDPVLGNRTGPKQQQRSVHKRQPQSRAQSHVWGKSSQGPQQQHHHHSQSQSYNAWSKPPVHSSNAKKSHFMSQQPTRLYNILSDTPTRSYSSRQSQQSSRNRMFDLKKMINDRLVCDLATDQNGSRFIQQQLEICSLSEKDAVFQQIVPEALRLCTDVFGNYVVQKFFEYGTREQKQKLALTIQYNILPLSLQMYGCRVVQKILESVDQETQYKLISELDGHVLDCVKDQNGNHVIQKCIEKVRCYNIDFILQAFEGRVFDLSTHPYGCRVIQRVLEYCDAEQKAPVLSEVNRRVSSLAKDQYGNYVLQHVLQHSAKEGYEIVVKVSENILSFSKHKFASNVVERCFTSCPDSHKLILLNAVVGDAETSPLKAMVRDQYANYVIQKMLETLNPSHQQKLIRKINDYVPNIRKIAFGKHIVQKIEKLYPQTNL